MGDSKELERGARAASETRYRNMRIRFSTVAQKIENLLRQVDSADVRVPEDSALIGIAVDLVPVVIRQLKEGLEIMDEIQELYGPDRLDEDLPEDDPFSLKGIGFLISSEFAARDLTDLAFFASTELRGCLDLLTATSQRESVDLETVASNCEAGTRRLRKALVSVESAIYEFEQKEAPRRKWFDVEVSLQIRQLYWNLRRETLGRPAEEEHMAERLRSVVYRLVAFRELSVYPFLRIDDRIQLRHLLKRILEWLNSQNRSEQDGKRLWQDLVSFAGILVVISQRQELQDHDRDLVMRAFNTLYRRIPPPSMVPQDLLNDLDKLLGLDDRLDQLILGRVTHPMAWREPLLRVQEQFNRPEDSVPSLDLFSD